METKSIADTFKIQSNFTRKERIFTEVIFSDPFLEFFEKTIKELSEENDTKKAEICTNLMLELDESIQQLKSENIDVRVQTLVLVKSLVDLVMESTSLHFCELKRKKQESNTTEVI